MTTVVNEILKAIADGGHTFSPEADGTYIMRPHNAVDVAETIVRYLIQRDALMSLSAQPATDWADSLVERMQ